jgi:hypothetical protein
MKLNSQQIAAVGQQIGADPLNDDDPVTDQLVKIFGEHTFYLSTEGLLVIEAMVDPDQDDQETGKGQFVRVATWADEQRSALQPIRPEPTSIVLDLDAAPQADGQG